MENWKLNIASLTKRIKLLTQKIVIDSRTIYSMVKAKLPEVNCLLILNIGYSHYGEGGVLPRRWREPCHLYQDGKTRCKIITLKDKSSQPKEYTRTMKPTTGLPKGSNSYGNRVTILGCNHTWRVTADIVFNNRSYSTCGTNKVLSRLEKLNLRSKNRPNHSINQNLHSLIYNIDLLTLAYNNIKSKPAPGMTPGVLPETLDGISYEVLTEISYSLKDESFKFKPGRRIMIPKPSGGERPLTIGSPRDKIVQEAIRIILEAIYEPLFLDSSHGFRPNRSCHTALKDVSRQFKSVTWIIEGDISKCFDSIDHRLLMNLIEKKILDRRFTNLIRKSLVAGYFDFKHYHSNIAGTPQGSIISPILANIFLHQLDVFAHQLKKEFDKLALEPGITEEYKKLLLFYKRAKYHNDIKKIKESMNERMKINYTDFTDPNYKRLFYIRYADDWLIGIRGSYKDALDIKNKVSEFCRGIELNLSDSKTKITGLLHDKVFFLGTLISRYNERMYYRMNSVSSSKRQALQLRFEAPIQRIISRFHDQGFMMNNKPSPKFIWLSNPHRAIVGLYNSVVRGYLNYYSFVHNYGKLTSKVMWILKSSCCKLLAAKYSIQTMASVYKKYGKDLTALGTKDKEKPLSFVKPSFALDSHKFNTKSKPDINEVNIVGISRASLEGLVCMKCGSNYRVEMHHIRKMKDLNPKNEVDKLMARIHRKQIPLCRSCHLEKHRSRLVDLIKILVESRVMRKYPARFGKEAYYTLVVNRYLVHLMPNQECYCGE